jgi:hypothetical protein
MPRVATSKDLDADMSCTRRALPQFNESAQEATRPIARYGRCGWKRTVPFRGRFLPMAAGAADFRSHKLLRCVHARMGAVEDLAVGLEFASRVAGWKSHATTSQRELALQKRVLELLGTV